MKSCSRLGQLNFLEGKTWKLGAERAEGNYSCSELLEMCGRLGARVTPNKFRFLRLTKIRADSFSLFYWSIPSLLTNSMGLASKVCGEQVGHPVRLQYGEEI